MRDRWLDGKAYFEHVKRAWGPPVWLEWLEYLRQKAIEQCGIPASMMRSDMTDTERCACEERVCAECRCNRRTDSMYRVCTCDTVGHDIGCAMNKCPVCHKTCRQCEYKDAAEEIRSVNLCPSADGVGSVCCKKCASACWKARPDLACPRCGGLVAIFDTSHPHKCLDCGWPGMKQRADVCRHPRLRVQLNGKIVECLTPGCKARFKAAWPVTMVDLTQYAGRVVLRYDELLLSRHTPNKLPDGWWLFPVIGEHAAKTLREFDYILAATTLQLINDDEVEIPEGGWVKQKVVKRADQAKETYKISYGERSPVKRVNNMEEAKAAFGRPPAMTKSDAIAFAEDYIRTQFTKYCTVVAEESTPGHLYFTCYCLMDLWLDINQLLELKSVLSTRVPAGVYVAIRVREGKSCGVCGCTKAIPKDWVCCRECRSEHIQ